MPKAPSLPASQKAPINRHRPFKGRTNEVSLQQRSISCQLSRRVPATGQLMPGGWGCLLTLSDPSTVKGQLGRGQGGFEAALKASQGRQDPRARKGSWARGL